MLSLWICWGYNVVMAGVVLIMLLFDSVLTLETDYHRTVCFPYIYSTCYNIGEATCQENRYSNPIKCHYDNQTSQCSSRVRSDADRSIVSSQILTLTCQFNQTHPSITQITYFLPNEERYLKICDFRPETCDNIRDTSACKQTPCSTCRHIECCQKFPPDGSLCEQSERVVSSWNKKCEKNSSCCIAVDRQRMDRCQSKSYTCTSLGQYSDCYSRWVRVTYQCVSTLPGKT